MNSSFFPDRAAGIVEVDHPQCPVSLLLVYGFRILKSPQPPEGGLAEPGDHFLDLRQSRIKPLVPSDVLICVCRRQRRRTPSGARHRDFPEAPMPFLLSEDQWTGQGTLLKHIFYFNPQGLQSTVVGIPVFFFSPSVPDTFH